jgi:hypothetical protein
MLLAKCILPNPFLLITTRDIHVLAKVIIEVSLAKATYYAYTTSQDNLLVSIALYSTQDIERLKLCQLQIMEKANKDLLQQIEANVNTIKELSKGWDNMLNTASQVATDLQYLVNKNTGLDLLMQIEISVRYLFYFQYIS